MTQSNFDLPPKPPMAGPSREEYPAWRDMWITYRDAVVDRVAELFDTHDDAAGLAKQLRDLAETAASGDPGETSWKMAIQSRPGNELNYAYTEGRLKHRRAVHRQDNGVWWSDEFDELSGSESADEVHRHLARLVIEDLFGWGDLDFVFLHKSLQNEGFIPPEE